MWILSFWRALEAFCVCGSEAIKFDGYWKSLEKQWVWLMVKSVWLGLNTNAMDTHRLMRSVYLLTISHIGGVSLSIYPILNLFGWVDDDGIKCWAFSTLLVSYFLSHFLSSQWSSGPGLIWLIRMVLFILHNKRNLYFVTLSLVFNVLSLNSSVVRIYECRAIHWNTVRWIQRLIFILRECVCVWREKFTLSHTWK